jgi:hypothetical protein
VTFTTDILIIGSVWLYIIVCGKERTWKVTLVYNSKINRLCEFAFVNKQLLCLHLFATVVNLQDTELDRVTD